MRHGKKFNKLSRTHSHRRQMLANMTSSLIMHKRIKTTLPKAKALRIYVEPLLTKSKEDTTHSRRVVFSYLQDKNAVTELFREIAPKIANRPGGYTRILKLNNRIGDNAEMAIIELVDFNEGMLTEKKAAKAKTTRRAGGAKKKAEATTEEGVGTETSAEEAKPKTKAAPKAKKEEKADEPKEEKPKAKKAPKTEEAEAPAEEKTEE